MPKPRKPWYRFRNLAFLFIAAVAALIGREVYLALTATPGHRVNYFKPAAELVHTYQPAGAADQPDAWPVLMDAIAILNQALPSGALARRVDFTVLYDQSGRDKPGPDETHTWAQVETEARDALAACRAQGLYERLATLATMKRAERPLPESGQLISILLPELGQMRQLARLNGARMAEARRIGDDAEFVAAFEQSLALGRISAHQFTIIDYLVGVAIDALALDHLQRDLTERPLPEPTMRALLAAMDRQLPLPPMSLPFSGERLSTLDIIQWTHTDDGRGSGRFIPSAAKAMLGSAGTFGNSSAPGGGLLDALDQLHLINLAAVAFPSKAATTRKAEEFYAQLLAGCDLPSAQRRATKFNPESGFEGLGARYFLLRIILPAFGKALQSHDQIDMDIAATRVMLAIEIFAARNGHYPAALSELTPSILPEAPIDPESLKPFGYRPLKPGEDTLKRADGTGRPYLLYSLGADGADAGGHFKYKNIYKVLVNPKLTQDFVINLPQYRPEFDAEK